MYRLAAGIVGRRLAVPAVCLALVAGTGWPPAGAQESGAQVPVSREQITLSFAPLVAAAAPAVVNVFSRRTPDRRQFVSPLMADPFFRNFFGDRFERDRADPQNALGSGVIVRPDGLVVTNFHVIRGADAVKVVLADRREFAAEVVLEDERTDLAVLRIGGEGEVFPHLTLGDSDQLQVGDLVLAIGNPFGVGQTVTSGIVSALARTNVGVTDFNFFIQTDAAINPGNSGGALLRMDGRLAGVNTAIFSRSGGNQGIGFAIPANMVRTVLNSVDLGGTVQRPWLGASGQNVTTEIADALGLDRPAGLVLSEIFPGGPADRAGLRVGDVITALDGHPVNDEDALRFRLATGPLGIPAEVSLVRDTTNRRTRLPREVAPEVPPRDETLLVGRHPLAGATVVNISPAVIVERGLAISARGVLVTGVSPGSPAARIGMRPLDVIVGVNGARPSAVGDLRRLVAAPQRRWRLAIRRGEQVLTVSVNG